MRSLRTKVNISELWKPKANGSLVETQTKPATWSVYMVDLAGHTDVIYQGWQDTNDPPPLGK